MSKFLKSFLLLVTAGLFTATSGAAETIIVNQETIGINFSRKDAQLSTTSDELYGYQSEAGDQGGFLAERSWQSFYAPNNNDPYGNPLTTGQAYAITTAGNPLLNVTLTKNSGNNIWGPNANKLLGSYLDDASNLTFSGLPSSGYDVAIIFAGDGGSYSRVTVNGVNKTYNAEGNLVDGDSKWGNRATSANDLKQLTATGTSTTGQVMYLANLSGETLTLQTYNEGTNGGRGTIAAIQIYLKSGTVEKTLAELPTPAWMWDGVGGSDSGEKVNGIPVYSVSGKVINADNVVPGGVPAKNFTFSMWTKKSSNPNWKDVCGFSDSTHQFKLEENANNGGLYVYGTTHGLNTNDTPKFIPSADFTADRLQLLTVVQENGIVKGYINGELKMTTLESTAWANLKSDDATMKYFAWGCSPTTGGGADRSFSISAADVRIYDVALSAEQVKALYAATPVDATYWATFNGDALTSDKVTSEDGFSLQGDAASYITVSGSNKAWNVSGDSWGTQSVLAEDSTTFTLSVNAKTGTNPNGLLFAFAHRDNGGLALRRTDGNHVVLTKGSSTDPILTGEAIAGDINYNNYTIVAAAGKLMLYINGEPVKDGEGNIVSVEASANELIDTNNFQPGRRFGGLLNGGAVEKAGNGAIDEMVAWKGVALTSVQVKNIYDLFLKTAISRRALATAEENWSDAEWNDGNDAAPTQGPAILISNVEGGTTLTMDASVTLDTFAIVGEKPVTVVATDANKLTSATTKIDADVTINAGVAALGTVAVGDGKTLTVKDNVTIDSILGGALAIDATAGDIEFTANTALTLDEIRQYAGKITAFGAGENGITLSYTSAQSSEFGPNLIFDGGTHSFRYQRANEQLFASGDSDENPTIWVKNNATLNFTSHDLSGWNGAVNTTGVIRVDNGSTLNFINNGGSTSYYRQRLYLEPGATMTIAEGFDKRFRLHGGVATAETAQLYVPGVDAEAEVKVATISGAKITFAKDDTNGLGVNVGANATLEIRSPFAYDTDDGKASPIAKYGDGTLLLKGGYEPTGAITINAGTLALGFTGALTNAITNNATFAADGENVVMNLMGATLSGNGSYLARNGAILKLTLTQAKANTIAANGGKIYIELTAAEQESEQTVTVDVSNSGSFQFVDANNNPLSAPNTNYVPSTDRTYDVATSTWANATAPSDYENVIINFGETSGQTVDLATILGDVTAVAQLTVTGANGGEITNVANVASCPAIIVDTVTMPAALAALAATIEVTSSLTLVGDAENANEVAGIISGDGLVKVVSGKVAFSNANTYTGGTDIAEGATLTISHTNALSTSGTITGAGTLVCDTVRPANMTGLTTGTAASGETPASGWTGTVWLKNVTTNASVVGFANADSSLTLEGSKGHFTAFTVKTLTLTGDSFGFQPSDGSSGASTAHNVMTIGALKGSGSLLGPTKNGSDGAYCYAYVIGDMSEFTGTLDTTSNGGRTVVWCGEASQSVNYHDYDGKIVLALDATIAANQTWSAVNGTVIQEGKTLTVNGALTGAIANEGALIYTVDTTSSNTFTGAGFIVANGEGVELDLRTATWTDFSGALNAINGATIKLPYAATAGKTLSFDEISTFVVVYSDAETEQDDLNAITVTGRGTLQFVDAAGNALPSSGSTYVPSVYTVTDEGGSWNVAPLQNNKITIDFAETEGETVDLAAILGEVTTLSKLTVKGTNGGTIANSAVTACPTVVILAGGLTTMPAELLNLATTVTTSTVEGASLYVTGETTTTSSNFPYTGNRHFETIKFTGSQSVGGDIDGYTVAEGETVEFLHNGGVRYQTSLVLDGGTIRTTQNTHVWWIGAANAVFTLKAGAADFSSISVDNDKDGLLIGYMGETHTFDIQGGTLDASNTSIVGYQPTSQYRQSGGTVKTKGFRQNGSNFTEMTLTGGTIELGSGGLPNLGMDNATFGGATIHAVANNAVAEALNMTDDATLSAAADTTMTVTSTFTGTATLSIDGAGTVDLSRATIANTIALDVKVGATVVVTAEQLSTFVKMTVAETATLKIKVNYTIDEYLTGGRKTYTMGEGSTIGGNVVWEGLTDTSTSIDGTTLNLAFAANPTLTGNAWWWDYEFNGNGDNIGSEGSALRWDGTRPYQGAEYTERVGEDTNQMLKLPARPWRDVSAWPSEATFVMYAKAGTKTDYHSVGGWDGAVDGKDNGILVSFGSSTQGNSHKTITLMTGANPENGDMRLVYADGTSAANVVDLVENLSVPNATTTYHLYAFVLETIEEKTHISVYVDGGLVATYTADSVIQLGPGFQIASVHGGPPEGLNRLANEDTATMDFLRVYNGVLSAEAMQSLADAYPYTSPNGTASRTVANADTVKTWIGAENELVWTQTTLANDNSGTTTDEAQVAPTAGSVVKVTVADETSVALNIPAGGVSYEALDISEALAGEGELTLTAVQDAGLMTIAGKTSIKTNVTIAANTVKIGAVDVAAEKTLTFDYSAYDFSDIWATTSIPLTGLASGNGTVAVAFPAEKPAQIASWACVKDPSTSTYAIVVTVDLSDLTGTVFGDACAWDDIVWTINNGETEVAPSNDFLRALPTVRLAVTGDTAILNLSEALTLNAVTVSGGTLTVDGAGLTVTTLTLNGGNVMATPDTLRASAIVGTAGSEMYTLHSQASYSNSQAFAMRFENCLLKKTGAGTFPIATNGVALNDVTVTLEDGALQLCAYNFGAGEIDTRIENTQFIYAGGTLTSYGWVRSASQITFNVPEGVDAVAFSGNNLTEPSNAGDAKCSVVKTGAGALTLYLKSAPYAGTTTIFEGTMAYAGQTCTLQGSISVAEGAAIKGSSNCTLASLTFADGAVIDATSAPVTATAVTLPAEDGTVTVRMTNHGEVLKTTGLNDVEKFVVETPVANCSLVVTERGLAYVAAPATGDVEFSAEVQEMLNAMAQAAAEYEGITSLTIEGITLSVDGENVVKADIAGLEVFESVPVLVVPDGENGTGVAMVNYVFGISDITVNGDGYIVVKASVDCLAMDNPVEPIEGEDAGEGEGEMPELPRPTFVNGVEVELLNGNTVIGEAVVDLENMANASEITITSTQTVANIFNGAVGTLDLTVKVKTR